MPTRNAQQVRRDEMIEDYLDLVRLTGDVGEALRATGRSYETWKRTLSSQGHTEAAEELSRWKNADTERLNYALGRQWQREKTAAGRN